MHIPKTREAARQVVTIGVLLVATVSSAGAQTAVLDGNLRSTIIVSDPASGGYNDPLYAASRAAGSDYSGVVNLWFRNSSGAVIHACTGSNLGGGKILTAAHCVSDGSSLIASSFTARFYQTGIGWVDVNGSGFAVKPGYTGDVIEENDVAVLTLGSTAPSFARTYGLASGNILGLTQTFAGYGRTGNGVTGGVAFSNQFDDTAILRRGLQTFESTCNTAGMCATASSPTPNLFGGVLLADFDPSGASASGSFMCAGLGFCGAGFGGLEEVTIGSGDSGGASFLDDWTISGVASFAEVGANGQGFFGFIEGHTCVAQIAGNDACTANYDFVTSQVPESTVTPEPASVVLLATGLIGVFGFARRRRA